MAACAVDRCDESVTKKGHTVCYFHWRAEKDGELAACVTCGRLIEDAGPLCFSCLKECKANAAAAPALPPRKAGQGCREMAAAVAKNEPFGMLLSRLTLGILRAPDYPWRVGAESEEAVGRELLKLPPGWFVRHDIMIGENWNADHVVVGPPGAFVLDTKFRSGEVKTTRAGIRVDGRKTKMADKVQDQAREISGRLRDAAQMRTWVQPVLVFDNPVRGKRDPDGVHVVGLPVLVEYLTELGRELEEGEVEHVGRVLLDDSTWPFVNAPKSEVRKKARALSRKERRKQAIAVAVIACVFLLVGKLILSAASSLMGPSARSVQAPKRDVKLAQSDGERSPRVEAIRARYQAVGSTQWKLTKVVKHVSGLSTESATVIGYFDAETLRKAEWSSGTQRTELTFHEGRVEFLFEKNNGTERRFYLDGNKVIWATQGSGRDPLKASDVAAAQPGVLEMGTRVVQALRAPSDQLTYEGGKLVSGRDAKPVAVPTPPPMPEAELIPPPPPMPAPEVSAPPMPEPEFADADAKEINRDALAAFVRSHKGAIQGCYEAELRKNPKLKGKIVMRFTITPAGTTDDVVVEENSLSGDEVASCATEVIQRWIFPIRPREPVPVAYPFVFAPAT